MNQVCLPIILQVEIKIWLVPRSCKVTFQMPTSLAFLQKYHITSALKSPGNVTVWKSKNIKNSRYKNGLGEFSSRCEEIIEC